MKHGANETAGATSTLGDSNMDVDVAAVRLLELLERLNFGGPAMSADDAREVAEILHKRLQVLTGRSDLPGG